MTDGIIQKIFKSYIDRSRRFNDDAYYGELFEKQAKEYEHLQQQLIEEIKKKQTRFGLLTSIPIKDLIGDSE